MFQKSFTVSESLQEDKCDSWNVIGCHNNQTNVGECAAGLRGAGLPGTDIRDLFKNTSCLDEFNINTETHVLKGDPEKD